MDSQPSCFQWSTASQKPILIKRLTGKFNVCRKVREMESSIMTRLGWNIKLLENMHPLMTPTPIQRQIAEEDAVLQDSSSFMLSIIPTKLQQYSKSKQVLLLISNTSMLLLHDAFMLYVKDLSKWWFISEKVCIIPHSTFKDIVSDHFPLYYFKKWLLFIYYV